MKRTFFLLLLLLLSQSVSFSQCEPYYVDINYEVPCPLCYWSDIEVCLGDIVDSGECNGTYFAVVEWSDPNAPNGYVQANVFAGDCFTVPFIGNGMYIFTEAKYVEFNTVTTLNNSFEIFNDSGKYCDCLDNQPHDPEFNGFNDLEIQTRKAFESDPKYIDKEYIIFNVLGQVIANGLGLPPNHLGTGTYFIKYENEIVQYFTIQ